MNLLVTFTFNVSLKTWKNSGILSRELKLYEELYKKYKIKTTFLTYGDNTDYDLINKNYYFLSIIPIFQNKKTDIKLYKFIYSVFYILINRNLFYKFHIVKTNQLHGSWIALLIKIICKKKYIVRMGFNFFSQNLKYRFIYNRLYKIILRYSDYVICTTSFIKDEYKKNFNITKKIEVIPNFIDHSIFHEFQNSKKLDFINVGRLHVEKNHQLIFKIIEKLQQKTNFFYNLTIIGEGPEYKSLKKLSIYSKVSTNFIKKIDNISLPSYYSSHSFYLCSSLGEGHPKTILEAMACGCIVIAPNVKGINNLLINNKTGFLYDLNDIEGVVSKIIKISSKNYPLSDISFNAKQFVYDNFDIQKIIKDEYKIYDKIGLSSK